MMTYAKCKSLDDIAQALNEDNDEHFDVFAYLQAVERIGAINTGDETYWAVKECGNGTWECLYHSGEIFTVIEIDEAEARKYIE